MVIYLSEIKLRPYQQKFIDDIREQMKLGYRHICGVAPCGSGKTIITGWMARETAQKGKRVLFMVHRKELIDQTSKTFSDLNIEHSIIASGITPDYKPLVQIASVQTLVRRLDTVPAPDLLIVDECHHILAASYLKIVKHWNPWLLGVTATPLRLGGITLDDVFDSMVIGPSIASLIKDKHLTNIKYFASPHEVDTSKLRSKFGEYIADDMVKLMDRPSVIDDVVKSYKEHANGKQTIVYCVNVAHSEHTAKIFNDANIIAAHVDGETKKSERNRIINEFRAGKITVLCNAELFGEGFDVPNCDCVILNRPTQSLTVYIQQSMRAMRPDPNNPDKVAIILDHVGNGRRFLDIDMDRQWTLNSNEIKNPMMAPTKTCPACQEEVYLAFRKCPHCGYIFVTDVKDETERLLTKHMDTRDKDYSDARIDNIIVHKPTFRDLVDKYIAEAKEKHYKITWISYKLFDFAETLEDFQIIADRLNYKKGWAWHKWQDKVNGVTLKKMRKDYKQYLKKLKNNRSDN